MPAAITLKVTEGKLKGQEFRFDERNCCIIGRAAECLPKLPDDEDHSTISRNHCLLDINPPDVRVRDFGSLNGTYVNGEKIGQREGNMDPKQGAQLKFPEFDLKHGDTIKLGDTVFRVELFIPAVCDRCQVEIPESQKPLLELEPGVYRCPACRVKIEGTQQQPSKSKCCAKCGKDVSSEIGENRQGEFVCSDCQAEPLEIINEILSQAQLGDRNLIAIQGFQILKKLGQGGMGAVYLAVNKSTGKQVALKVMLPQVALSEHAKESFLREVENTKALRHSNVVQLHESGCSNGIFYFTIEFCEGGSIDKLMEKRGGTLSIAEAAKITLQALAGLEYAHQVPLTDSRGLVHRDLKPHNIFLSGMGSSCIAKVGDFGLAKAFDLAGLSGRTRSGAKMGTPCFMPRQQVINFKYSKPEVDVWAMAASLYNMLTNYYPRDFTGRDVWQTVLQTDAVPIRNRLPSLPQKLAKVIDDALRDKPAIHFKTATDLRRALEEVL